MIDGIVSRPFTTFLMMLLPNRERERDGLNKGRFASYGGIRLHFPTPSTMFLNRLRNNKTRSSFGLVLVSHGAVYNEMQGSVRVPQELDVKESLVQERCWPTYILEVHLPVGPVPTQHATN